MTALETTAQLESFENRGAGTDAERRAASWLAAQLREAGRQARIETFWCRPNWALAHAWHVALALAGSLVSVSAPRVGGAMILVALLSLVVDGLTGRSPGRRLTPERASQNVVSPPPAREWAKPVCLILTANYDAGRTGLIHRRRPRRAAASVRRLFGRFALGWLACLGATFAWLVVTAILRARGDTGAAVGLLQLVPTVGLVITLALLLDQATAAHSPAASDNGSGAAVALTLARALAAGPPANAEVELVLQGASDGTALGLRRYLRARRSERRAGNTVVLGIAPCGAGNPRWWISDGQLLPTSYFGQLRRLAAETAASAEAIGRDIAPKPVRTRGSTPALPAAARHLPALTIGALDDHDLAPRSHTDMDSAARLDPASLERTVQLGLVMVDAIDGLLRRTRALRQEKPGG